MKNGALYSNGREARISYEQHREGEYYICMIMEILLRFRWIFIYSFLVEFHFEDNFAMYLHLLIQISMFKIEYVRV